MRIVVGIPACATTTNERLVHATPARYAEALLGGADALPVMIPPVGEAPAASTEPSSTMRTSFFSSPERTGLSTRPARVAIE